MQTHFIQTWATIRNKYLTFEHYIWEIIRDGSQQSVENLHCMIYYPNLNGIVHSLKCSKVA